MVSGIPPFERFYESHKGEVLAFLRRRAGRDRADDLFQETFLRALRAYGRLEHGEHLRAWVLTIATNAVVDAARRERPTAELSVEPASEDQRPAVEELAPLTDDLPPKERAAVVLRYGYDLDYDTIAAALGSNEQAARQAASAGVRRLRKEKEQRWPGLPPLSARGSPPPRPRAAHSTWAATASTAPRAGPSA